ncbi:DUF928 domain-containing protein [filamentous cyanobacterium LEGE 11480]|uniref:DUF928 domain-containing protein n=1 Tax=Romeriopsis navalis LEGE 11480 TaxID=2777977 RepID=A0A928Z0R4_9CYAN|nr:DUF928 domain-containing protein [Romeriopsis navalis]MBE9028546.1 DUF928 domain-containing protein [Romeriopsis navalis LEGE 11480]
MPIFPVCRLLIALGLPVLFTTVTIAGMATPVSARSTVSRRTRRRRYVPRKRRRAPRRTEAGGTRGCSVNTQSANIQLLVPATNVAHTDRGRPTFSWHITNPDQASLPVRFTLIEPGVLKPLYQQTLQANQSGVMQVTLPKTAPTLKADRSYRWMVSWSCDLKRPSEQLHRRAWIERVETDATLNQTLKAAKTVPDQIIAYAQSGIWHEAIDLAANHRQNPQVNPLWQELLQDGKLPAIK